MRRFLAILFIGFLMVNCGSKKRIAKREAERQKREQIVLQDAKEENTSVADTIKVTIPPPVKVPSNTEAYIEMYSSIAQNEMKLYGIPASITLAQGILESGSGKGRLSREANNHFGIKCHEWTGARIYHDDDALQECFRKYVDAKYSFRDHSLFLTERRRYSGLFDLRKDDYKRWAKGLKAAGYATDRKYPDKLISLIERYKLYEYDKEVLGASITPYEKPEDTLVSHFVIKGDTLYSISKKYNMTVEEIQKLNGLTDTTISIGQELILKPTPKEY